MTQLRTALLTLCALVLAACGGGGSSGASGSRTTRGAITAKSAGAITVNGLQVSTAGAAIRVDDHPSGADALEVGMVVTVKGYDDRLGGAAEIEVEHGLEGKVDDRGTDFVVIGGTRVQIDDTVRWGDGLGPDAIAVGSMVAVSGVPAPPLGADDRGGLRASRVDPASFGDDQRVDVKGFVSSYVAGESLQLRLTPDATTYYAVDLRGATADGPLSDGAYVEVVTSVAPTAGVAPVVANLVASAIHVEDRFGGYAEIEVEGYVSSVAGDDFYVDGVQVHAGASTRYELGQKADILPGVKLEAEGRLDGEGVLQAHKISFRPGVRITAVVEGYTGTDLTMLGIPVQVPSHADARVAISGKVEVRGTPTPDGSGLVALRVDDESGGNADRVELRAVATAKGDDPSSPTFTVFGFAVSGGVYRYDRNGSGSSDDDAALSPSELHALVVPGRTVLKIRASSAADVSWDAKTWSASEVEIER